DAPWQVPGVDILEPCVSSDARRTLKHRGRRRSDAGHPVVRMERRDVPRYVDRDAGEERRQPAKFLFAVVEAGNEERDDLDPDAGPREPRDGVENWLQPSAQLTVSAIVEALEIDLVKIDMRSQVFEDALGAVAVRHEPGDQPSAPGFLEYFNGPFSSNERL